ncbi:MAG TPA: FAD-dependent oxidoreductase [Acidobacteriota bacterium]|nr:FAD-dependent oxidoreductase [Acidobacteriota bacterium]
MSQSQSAEVLIVGAGIAGLSLARHLQNAGIGSILLERAAGVGGRCATRRVEGRPVDHGTPFLHGRDAGLLAALDAVTDATPLPGWPHRRIGGGVPCQPEAFEGVDRLLAFREGLTRFPKHLARGLDVRLRHEIASLRPADDAPLLEVVTADGVAFRAGTVALTMPAPSADRWLAPLEERSSDLAATRVLRRQIRTLPCLAVIATYAPDAARTDFDVCYPSSSTMVHAIVNDAAKRGAGSPPTLVVQGRPRFSREFMERPRDEWARELLWEAGEFLGAWVERPVAREEHVWRHARIDPTSELAAPLLVGLENGSAIALCGDGFSPHGGVEGAFRSGRSLAARIQTLRAAPVGRP